MLEKMKEMPKTRQLTDGCFLRENNSEKAEQESRFWVVEKISDYRYRLNLYEKGSTEKMGESFINPENWIKYYKNRTLRYRVIPYAPFLVNEKNVLRYFTDKEGGKNE